MAGLTAAIQADFRNGAFDSDPDVSASFGDAVVTCGRRWAGPVASPSDVPLAPGDYVMCDVATQEGQGGEIFVRLLAQGGTAFVPVTFGTGFPCDSFTFSSTGDRQAFDSSLGANC